jgi:tetratricopeptide (TPR) repeat protein
MGLKEAILRVYEDKKFRGPDLLNIFTLLMACYGEAGDKDLEEKIADILGKIGSLNLHFQLPEQSIDGFASMVERSSLGENNKAGTLNNLGNVYSNTGRIEKAEQAYSEALDIYRRLATANPRREQDVAGTLNNLGNVQQYRQHGKGGTSILRGPGYLQAGRGREPRLCALSCCDLKQTRQFVQ